MNMTLVCVFTTHHFLQTFKPIWPKSKITKEMNCFEHDSWVLFLTLHFFITYEWAHYNTRLERLTSGKHSILFGSFISY
jgi:hypothetical protein